MRRIFKNTTAIAACLTLLAPHMAAAQVAADSEAQVVPPAAETAPETTPETVVPEADAAAEPADDAMTDAQAPSAETAEGAEAEAPAAEMPAEDAAASEDSAPEADTEAPAADTEAEPAAEAAAEGEASPTAATSEEATAPEAEAAQMPAADQAEDSAAAPAAVGDDAAPVENADLDAAMKAEQESQPAATAEADAAPEASAENTEASEAVDAAREQASGTNAVDDQEGTSDTTEPTATAQPQAEADTDATADTGAEEASDLDAAMAAEQESQAASEMDTTAAGADTTSGETAADAETSADAAQTAPAEGNAQGSASADAATETQAPNVAALDENATSEVTEEEVTEENSRSSSEDFATTVQEAASAESSTNEASDDSDDDNDLTKALLLGLGGVAVGAMLSNNRQVQLSSPDRLVVTRPDGTQQLIKDDVALLRQPGSTVATENFDDGSSRTIVTRSDGSRVVTIRDADLRVLRRTLVSADGTETRLIDETTAVEPVDIATLPQPAAAIENSGGDMDEASLREALMREAEVDRRFSLSQIRDISEVRSLVTPIDVNGITFETNSAAIDADQAKKLTALGNVISEAIAENPNEIFLIEGHTDTVGDEAANLALSDRRAESVALALSEYFEVAPENMVVQGYGEQTPKVQQEGDVRENRRVAVRRITGLLQTASN
ncbi:OmpA family protein [Paracoccus sediminilitoris]|uniref:OmpA family protein n=1 Tax=Paracoccus sediminilitoris TaxID=2202419 RepID=UPI000DB9D7DB|nr:OmpA family protein [Paracoccus sediminilitoris]